MHLEWRDLFTPEGSWFGSDAEVTPFTGMSFSVRLTVGETGADGWMSAVVLACLPPYVPPYGRVERRWEIQGKKDAIKILAGVHVETFLLEIARGLTDAAKQRSKPKALAVHARSSHPNFPRNAKCGMYRYNGDLSLTDDPALVTCKHCQLSLIHI